MATKKRKGKTFPSARLTCSSFLPPSIWLPIWLSFFFPWIFRFPIQSILPFYPGISVLFPPPSVHFFLPSRFPFSLRLLELERRILELCCKKGAAFLCYYFLMRALELSLLLFERCNKILNRKKKIS